MNIEVTSFGGLLLHTSRGDFAVNGGGSLEALELAYLASGEPPRGIILTSEHPRHSRNISAFANMHRIPVLITLRTWAALREHFRKPVLSWPLRTNEFAGLAIEYHFLCSDSREPTYLTLRDGEDTLGIVPDGRITPDSAPPLLECRTLFFDNLREKLLRSAPPPPKAEKRSKPPKSPQDKLLAAIFGENVEKPKTSQELQRRIKYFSNTAEEIRTICAGYTSVLIGNTMICLKN